MTWPIHHQSYISASKVARFEHGTQIPGLSDICALLVSLHSRFEDIFTGEIALAKADIHARIADHKPPVSTSHKTAKRVESFRALKAALNTPHGAHC